MELSQEQKRQSWLTIENKKILLCYNFLKKYLLIGFDFAIEYLNKHSKDFRHVSHILSKEKLILKREYGNCQAPNIMALLSTAINVSEPPKHSLEEMLEETDDIDNIILASKEVDEIMNAQSRFDKLLSTIFYFALSQSEIICYFFMILNHLQYASLLSVPLPISIFLWAMLCIPRPTKTFWITSITYIEAVVVIKYLFQFNIYPWNQSTNALNQNLIKAISIIGIEKKDNFAIFDLFALLVIFLHRTILKRLGLWRDYLSSDDISLISNEDENKNKFDFDAKEEEKTEKTEERLDAEDVAYENGCKSPTLSNYKVESKRFRL